MKEIMLKIISLGLLFALSPCAFSEMHNAELNVFTLSGNFVPTDISVMSTVQGTAVDPSTGPMRAIITASINATGGGIIQAKTNRTPIVHGNYNTNLLVVGGLTSGKFSKSHLINKDETQTISDTTGSAPILVTIWASDAGKLATETTFIDKTIPPPTYSLENKITTVGTRTTTIGPAP